MEREQQKADFILSNAVLVFVCLFFSNAPFRNDASGCQGDDDITNDGNVSSHTWTCVCHAFP